MSNAVGWTVDRETHPECMHGTCESESDRLVKLVEGSYRVYCNGCLAGLDDMYVADRPRSEDGVGITLDVVKQSQLTDLVEEGE
jgi:hypothetical protein